MESTHVPALPRISLAGLLIVQLYGPKLLPPLPPAALLKKSPRLDKLRPLSGPQRTIS
jgi:hypothetical protein